MCDQPVVDYDYKPNRGDAEDSMEAAEKWRAKYGGGEPRKISINDIWKK